MARAFAISRAVICPLTVIAILPLPSATTNVSLKERFFRLFQANSKVLSYSPTPFHPSQYLETTSLNTSFSLQGTEILFTS